MSTFMLDILMQPRARGISDMSTSLLKPSLTSPILSGHNHSTVGLP